MNRRWRRWSFLVCTRRHQNCGTRSLPSFCEAHRPPSFWNSRLQRPDHCPQQLMYWGGGGGSPPTPKVHCSLLSVAPGSMTEDPQVQLECPTENKRTGIATGLIGTAGNVLRTPRHRCNTPLQVHFRLGKTPGPGGGTKGNPGAPGTIGRPQLAVS